MLLRAVALALVVALLAVPAGAQNAKRSKPATGAPAEGGAGAAAPTAADPVVAIVNGAAIHRSDVQEAVRMMPPQRQQISPDKLYMEILDRMVGTALVAQA